tara:strand:+ start:128 stop:409 length:282 start_codon:yes stop_codon:yes gene_type:complete
MSSRENYGWYSKKQHSAMSDAIKHGLMMQVINSRETSWEKIKHNSYIYQTGNGDKVLCTEITSTTEYPSSKYDDFVFLGKLDKFVESCYTEIQ